MGSYFTVVKEFDGIFVNTRLFNINCSIKYPYFLTFRSVSDINILYIIMLADTLFYYFLY